MSAGWLFQLKIPGLEPDTPAWPAACIVRIADEEKARQRVAEEAPGEHIIKATALTAGELDARKIEHGGFRRIYN